MADVYVFTGQSARNQLNVSRSDPSHARKLSNARKPLPSAAAADTRLGSCLSCQGRVSAHNHRWSCNTFVTRRSCFFSADSALNGGACRELHLCVAELERCLKYYTVYLNINNNKKDRTVQKPRSHRSPLKTTPRLEKGCLITRQPTQAIKKTVSQLPSLHIYGPE